MKLSASTLKGLLTLATNKNAGERLEICEIQNIDSKLLRIIYTDVTKNGNPYTVMLYGKKHYYYLIEERGYIIPSTWRDLYNNSDIVDFIYVHSRNNINLI